MPAIAAAPLKDEPGDDHCEQHAAELGQAL